MNYKLIGIRPNHQRMKEMVGKHLYRLKDGNVEKVYIIGLRISDTTNQWEFRLTGESDFRPNEPLFASVKSIKRYAKQKGIEIHEIN